MLKDLAKETLYCPVLENFFKQYKETELVVHIVIH